MAFANLKSELIHAALLVLGADADKVVAKLHGAEESKAALTAALAQCVKLVTLTIDEKKAMELKRKCTEILQRQ